MGSKHQKDGDLESPSVQSPLFRSGRAPAASNSVAQKKLPHGRVVRRLTGFPTVDANKYGVHYTQQDKT